MSYTDPDNKDEIIEQLKELDSTQDIRSMIEEIFPGWLKWYASGYSKDYPHLTNNWSFICRKNNTSAKKVIIVDEIFFDKENHFVLMLFCEIMTRNGYVVRRKEEYVSCKNCEKAIPSKHVWQQMKNAGLIIPQIWSDKCSEC